MTIYSKIIINIFLFPNSTTRKRVQYIRIWECLRCRCIILESLPVFEWDSVFMIFQTLLLTHLLDCHSSLFMIVAYFFVFLNVMNFLNALILLILFNFSFSDHCFNLNQGQLVESLDLVLNSISFLIILWVAIFGDSNVIGNIHKCPYFIINLIE